MDANKARQISQGNDPNAVMNALNEIWKAIEKSAKAGEYHLDIRGYGFGEGACYCSEEKWPDLCQKIVQRLREDGFVCTHHSKELQFVDLYLKVSWR